MINAPRITAFNKAAIAPENPQLVSDETKGAGQHENAAKSRGCERLTFFVCLGIALLIFGVDVLVPRGIMVASLYVIPVILLHNANSKFYTITFAILCAALTFLGELLSPDIGVPAIVIMADFAIVLTILSATTMLSVIATRRASQLRAVTKLLTLCAWTKKVRVRDEWIPLEAYLRNELGVTITHGMSEESAGKFLSEIRIEDRTRG
ncbi:MAG: hypothetical protein M3119_06155 [Verrucomicrobiota bacterium]|nr:hypothetical protein [Verrucomicrobiota bacterium]